VSLAGPAFALLSAACWGAGDFFGGVATRAAGVLAALLLSQVLGTLLVVLLVPFANEPPPTLAGVAWAAGAGACGVIGVGCLYLALSRGTMALVAPLTALIGASVPAVIGVAAGEPVTPLLALGIASALAAVVVISLPDGRGTPRDAPWDAPEEGPEPVAGAVDGARSRAPSWPLVIVAGLGFAGFYLGVDHAHEAGAGTFQTLLAVRVASTTLAVIIVVTLVALGRAARPRMTAGLVPLALLTALGDTGGNLFYVLASAVGTLSVTVVLASLYPVSTVLLARVVLRERLSPRRLAGVALAIAGVVLISAGALGT
jgi:drug/metabolite transporter (DMT)-like permease